MSFSLFLTLRFINTDSNFHFDLQFSWRRENSKFTVSSVRVDWVCILHMVTNINRSVDRLTTQTQSERLMRLIILYWFWPVCQPFSLIIFNYFSQLASSQLESQKKKNNFIKWRFNDSISGIRTIVEWHLNLLLNYLSISLQSFFNKRRQCLRIN